MFQDNMYLVLYEKKFICTFVLTHCLCIRYLVSNDEYATQLDKITLTIEYLEGPAYILKIFSSSISQKRKWKISDWILFFAELESQKGPLSDSLTQSITHSWFPNFPLT